jgi:hypothetical protein
MIMTNADDLINRLSQNSGLTKLEWFAGLTLQGLLANSNPQVVSWETPTLAKIAVEQAEELIRHLNKAQT